jgi:hypothetical protein
VYQQAINITITVTTLTLLPAHCRDLMTHGEKLRSLMAPRDENILESIVSTTIAAKQSLLPTVSLLSPVAEIVESLADIASLAGVRATITTRPMSDQQNLATMAIHILMLLACIAILSQSGDDRVREVLSGAPARIASTWTEECEAQLVNPDRLHQLEDSTR